MSIENRILILVLATALLSFWVGWAVSRIENNNIDNQKDDKSFDKLSKAYFEIAKHYAELTVKYYELKNKEKK